MNLNNQTHVIYHVYILCVKMEMTCTDNLLTQKSLIWNSAGFSLVQLKAYNTPIHIRHCNHNTV